MKKISIIINLIFLFVLLDVKSIEPNKENLLRTDEGENEDEIEEIIDPKIIPKKDDPDIYYFPFLHVNDIHGSYFEKKVLLPSGKTYTIGGIDYLAKYVKIMKEEWGERFMFIDSGDIFQGALESTLANGENMMDFFNKFNLSYSVIGNHEFDFGIDFLKNYMEKSKFKWLMANIANKTTGDSIFFPKQKKSVIFDIGNNIKIGIIGITTLETPTSTATNVSEIDFQPYVDIVIEESENLRKEGANAIVVLAHLGLKCAEDPENVILSYQLRDKNLTQGKCEKTDEGTIFLNKLPPGTIDLLFAGHKHAVVHQWVNDFPVISNDRNGKTAGIVYLPFDRKTGKLLKDKILMEGPLPICDKIFKSNKRCDVTILTDEEEKSFGELKNFKFHGVKISKDEEAQKISEKYRPIFDEYDKDLLTFTKSHFESSKEEENPMGNMYTDFLRHISGADIAVVNPGSFRVPFYRGNITNATVYSLDPFGNNIVKFKAYGWEVRKIMSQLQAGKKGFYPVSGLKCTVRTKPSKKLLDVKIFDGKESEIEDQKLYTIVSIEFCFPLTPGKIGGDDFSKVSLWFKPRDAEYISLGGYNVTRDIFIDYLRNIDELKTEKYVVPNKPRLRKVKNNKN